MVNNTVDNSLERQIAKKIFKSKFEACQCLVDNGHYLAKLAFKHSISFPADLAANFGCNRFRIMPDIVSKLLRWQAYGLPAVLFHADAVF